MIPIGNKLDIFIITYNRVKYLQQCVETIFTQTFPIKLHIWDNGSEDETKDYIRNLFKLHKDKCGTFFDSSINYGTAQTRNLGIKAIDSDVILMSDDDIDYESNALEHYVKAWNLLIKEKFRIGIMGLNQPFGREHYRKKIFRKRIIIDKYELHDITTTPPNSWLLYKPAIFLVGGFNLPKNRLMGYSSWKLPEKLSKIGYCFIRINKINGKAFRACRHMDQKNYYKNHVEYYRQTGYEQFRFEQKHPGKKYENKIII